MSTAWINDICIDNTKFLVNKLDNQEYKKKRCLVINITQSKVLMGKLEEIIIFMYA